MAYQNNHKRYQVDIGFNVDPKGIKLLQQELKKLEFLKDRDYSKLFGSTSEKYKEEAKKMRTYASEVRMALQAAYNPKLKTVNIEAFNRIIKQSGLNLSELSKYFSNVGVAGQNVSTLLTNSMTKFNVKIKESHQLLDKMGRTLANTLKWSLSASLINNVSGSIQQAWGFTKNLQQSLTNIRMVTGKNADEMKRFAQEANKAASQLGRTTTDYTKASLIYAQQGLSDAEIKKRSEITLKTANVTGQSTEAVSEELTAVWNGYKASAAEAEIYVDRLAAVASTTASNLSELSTGMSKVAAAAASLGVGEEQLAAQLSTIISVTRQAPETVGTALKTIYSRILDIQAGIDEDGTTLGTYSGKLAELGIKVLDASGKLRNMGQVMEEIGSKWRTFSKEQQTYIAQIMAGQRQYTNLIALFDNYQDKYISALKTAQGAEGTLNKQNKAYMEDINTKINQMTAATEKMWMNLIDTDGFKGIINDLTKVINKVDQLFQSIGGGKAVLNSIGAIATQLMSKTMASGINTFINNRVQSKEQKASLKQAQTDIQDKIAVLEAQGKGDSAEAKTLRDKARFLPNMQHFSNQSISKINQLWDQSASAGIQADIAKKQKEEKFDPLKKLAGIKEVDESNLQGIQANIEAANEVFKTDQDAVTQIIENSALNIFQVQTEEIKTATEAVNNAKKTCEDAIAKAEEAKEKLKNYTNKKEERDTAKQTYEDLKQQNQDMKKDNKNKRDELEQKIADKNKQIRDKEAQLKDMVLQQGRGFRLKENITNEDYAYTQADIQRLREERKTLQEQFNNLSKEQRRIARKVNNAGKVLQKAQDALGKEGTNNRTLKAGITRAENKVEKEKQNVNQAEKDRIKAIGESRLKAFNNSFLGTIKDKEGKERQYDLMKYIKAGQQQGASDELKGFAQQYKQLTKEIEESGNATAGEIQELDERVKSFFNALNQYAKQSAGNLESEGQNAMEALQKQKQALKKAKQAAEEAKSGMRQATIQGILQLTGALGQLNMTIQNFANIGNIWDNEDLTETEKFEQTISNLLITIPMLITGYASLSSALEKFSEVKAKHKALEEAEQAVKEKNIALQNLENAQQGTNTVIEGANASAKKTGAKASNNNANAKKRETKEIEKQNTTLIANTKLTLKNVGTKIKESFTSIINGIKGIWNGLSSHIGKLGAGLTIAVSAVYAAAAANYAIIAKQKQKSIEMSQRQIEKENEKQQTYNKQKDIVKQVEALNEAYKKGEITTIELQNKTKELQEQYKNESDTIKELIKDYKNLGISALNAKRKIYSNEKQSLEKEKKQQENIIRQKYNSTKTGESLHSWQALKTAYNGAIGAAWGESSEVDKVAAILGNGSWNYVGRALMLGEATSGRAALHQIQKLQDYIDSDQADTSTQFYSNVQSFLSEISDDIKQLEATQEEINQNYANNSIVSKDYNYSSKLNEASNLKEYTDTYLKFSNQVRTELKGSLDEDEIDNKIFNAISDNVSADQVNLYQEKAQLIETFGELNEQQINDATSLLEKYNSAQIQYIKSLNMSPVLLSFQEIYDIMKKTSELDFSGFNELTDAGKKARGTHYMTMRNLALKLASSDKNVIISDDEMEQIRTEYEKTHSSDQWETFKTNFQYQPGTGYQVKTGKSAETGNNIKDDVITALDAEAISSWQTGYQAAKRNKQKIEAWQKTDHITPQEKNEKQSFTQPDINASQQGIDNYFNNTPGVLRWGTQQVRDPSVAQKAIASAYSYSEEAKATTLTSVQNVIDSIGQLMASPYLTKQEKQSIKKQTQGQVQIIDNKITSILNSGKAAPSVRDAFEKYLDGDEFEADIQALLDIYHNGQQKINEKLGQQNLDNASQMINELSVQGLLSETDASKLDTLKKSLINKKKPEDTFSEDWGTNFTQLQGLYKDYSQHNADRDLEAAQKSILESQKILYSSIVPVDSDINTSTLGELGNHLQNISTLSLQLSSDLRENGDTAKQVSENILRYNVAIQQIIKSYNNWLNILQQGADQDKLELLPDLKNVYGDYLDINAEKLLSTAFFLNEENFKLLKQAAIDGVEQSYNDLIKAIKEDIIKNIKIQDITLFKQGDTENNVPGFKNIDAVFSYFQEKTSQWENYEIGAPIIDTQGFIETCNFLIDTTDLTAESLKYLLKTVFGVDAVISQDQIESLFKAANFSYLQSQRSYENQKSLAQIERARIENHKELNKYLEDERDLYHDINREIAKMDRTLSRLETTQQGLTGVELYNNLTQQNAALNAKSNKLKTKSNLQEQDLVQSRTKLSSKYGVTFTSNGEISNYLDILAFYENQVNAATAKKNSIINSMNAWTDADGDVSSDYYLGLKTALTQVENDYNHINDKYSDLKTALSDYDSLLDQHEDTIDKQTQTLRKQIAINVQKFDLKVSLQLDLTEAKKNWEEFKKNVLNKDDILNPDTMGSKEKDVNQAKVNYGDRMKDAQKITSSIDQILTEIDNFNRAEANGETYQSNLFNSVSQAYTKLTELQEKGEQALEDAAKYADIIKQAYLDAFSYVQEEFDKQNNYYSFISQQLSHDVSLMDLIYGSRGGRYKDNYYNQMNSFGLDQIDMLKQQQQFWAKQEAAATDEAAKKIAHENWENVTKSLNSTTEQAIQNLKSQFENMIDTIVSELEDSLTNGHGFDYITLEWDILKGHADMYLDTVNSAFAIKNTQYLFNKAISDTSELRNQQALKKVMQQQMQILKEKDKLTQYDVDRAEKVLEVEKARIALEEARNSKTTMRLKRDASGNYSYQFTADEGTIDQVQNNLDKAQNDLYNFDLQAWRSNNENAVAVFKDAMSQIAEIRKNDSLSEQQKQERIALIQKDAQEKMTFYAQENNSIRTNLEQSTYDSMVDLMGNSEINYSDMIQGMNSESQNFINKFNSNPDSVMNMFNEAIQSMQDKATEYNEKIANVVETAGLNFGNLKSAIDPVVQSEAAMVTNNDALISSMDSTIAKATAWKTTLENIESWWKGVYDQTSDALTKAQEYLKFKLNNDLNGIQNSSPEGSIGGDGNTTNPTLNNSYQNYGEPGNEGEYSGDIPGYTSSNEEAFDANQAKNDEKTIAEKLEYKYAASQDIALSKGDFFNEGYSEARYQNYVKWKKKQLQFLLKTFDKNNMDYTTTQDFFVNHWSNKKFGKIMAEIVFSSFDTGGYTGDWNSSDGKLAVLHEKELVLNKDDTENMLKMLEFSRTMSELVQNNVLATLSSQKQYLNSIQQQMSNTTKTYQQKILEKQKMATQALEQQVKIEANFPSVTSHKEIEQAFSNLVNLATQKALKYNKN